MGSTNRSYNILRSGQDDLSLSSRYNSSSGNTYFPPTEECNGVKIHSNKVWVSNDPIDESIFEKLGSSICESRGPRVQHITSDKHKRKEFVVKRPTMRSEEKDDVNDDLDRVNTVRAGHVAHVAYVTNVSVASVCLCCTGQQARRCSLNVGKSEILYNPVSCTPVLCIPVL